MTWLKETRRCSNRETSEPLVVEGDGLIQDTEVSRFLDVCHRTEDKPHGVVVEAAADVVVAAFGQRLVLVVASSVGELGRSYVDDSFAGSFRYLMHEAHEVLVGVAETHSTPMPLSKKEAERDMLKVIMH